MPLLNMHPEGLLQQEIRDIIDELEILIHITRKQEEVLSKFISNTQDILGTEESHRKYNTTNPITIIGDYAHVTVNVKKEEKPPDQLLTKTIREQQKKSFDKRSKHLRSKVTDLITELDGLKTSALSTAQSVSGSLASSVGLLLTYSQINDLITLKQQQASVVQAYQAMKQGEETVKQGRAIMLFTVMTIIFVRAYGPDPNKLPTNPAQAAAFIHDEPVRDECHRTHGRKWRRRRFRGFDER
jgi:hypothetical protein